MSSVLPILAAVAVAAVLVAGAVLTLRRTRRSRLGQGEIVRREALLARELEAIFHALERDLRPGIATVDLEQRVAHLLEARGLRGYFKGDRHYPALITASVNEEVINTLPSRRPLAAGDLVKLQVGVSDGVVYAYQGWTFPVGEPRAEDRRLLEGGRAALAAAVSRATVGRSNADLTAVLHATLEGACLKPSRDFVGHQIGSAPRKSPQVPCAIGISSGAPSPLEEGMVLSLLVIAHAGQPDVMVAEDGWNVIARDGTRSALFSHLVVVRKGKAETLTSEYR